MDLDDFSSDAVNSDATGVGKYGTPTSILDRLEKTESSGNPKAVNAASGALGAYQFLPSTVKMLGSQGMSFDPMNRGQSRDAADFYLQQLAKQNGGDMSKALAAYGGFVTQNPAGYVGKVAPPYKPAIDDFSSDGISSSIPASTSPSPAPAKGATPAPTGQDPGSEFIANQLSGAASAVVGGYKGLAKTVAGLAQGKSFEQATSEGADAVNAAEDALTYQPRTQTGQTLVNAFGSKWNPLNWPSVAGQYLGDKLSDAGAPGAGAIVNATATTAPMLLGVRGARAGVANVVDAAAPLKTVPEAARVEPTMEAGPPAAAPAPTSAAPAQSPVSPASPQPTGTTVPAPTAALKTTVAPADQAARAQVLNDVGFTQSRDSAVQGDARARAVEYQMSKFDEPAGQAAAQQFANEQQTLGDYTRGMIDKAGGTLGTDQGSLYARGQAIVRPIQALRDWFDQKASSLYQAADERAQGQPVTLDGFGSTLTDPSLMTQPDRVLLRDAAASFAKKSGMTVGDDGSYSGTALQAETVRKWLNAQRTSSNGGYVDALKGAMDDDVGKSAGGPIYDAARQLWSLRQSTLGDPKGISSLLDEEGTNRAVPFDRVPDNVTRLPQDQFAHIVSTLQDMPPELQGIAGNALGEIKAQFLNKMLDGATTTRGGNGRAFWNGTAVRNVINDNSGKLNAVLSPDEQAALGKLQHAGDILSFDPSYPGAAAQAQNAVKHGLMSNMVGHAVTGAGALGGALVGAPGAGAVLGRVVADKAQSALAQRQAMTGWNRGNVSLRDLMGNGP